MFSTPNINRSEIKTLPLDQLVDMPDNFEMFGIDQDEVSRLADQFLKTGFHGYIEVVPYGDKYLIVSGHQRKETFKKLGWPEIPCNITYGLSEEQIHDKWISSNVNTRKFTPYRYYLLIKDAERVIAERGIKGNKRNIIAEQLGISGVQVFRYKTIEKFPEELQKLCDDPIFPFTAALACKDFNDDQKYILNERIKQYNYDHPNVMISSETLSSLIASIRKASEEAARYDDPPKDEDFHTGKIPGRVLSTQEDSYQKYKANLDERFAASVDSSYSTSLEDNVVDIPIRTYAEMAYKKISGKHFMVMNNNSMRNTIHLLRDIADALEKKL